MEKNRKEIFIEKAKKLIGHEIYDYSEVEYINNRTPVKIIDTSLDDNGIPYGEFWQTPSNHLKGHGHPKKRNKKISKTKCLTQDEIIDRFKKIHINENMDYSEVVYKNMHTKVKIICRDLDNNGNEYGEFWQEPCVHLKGCTHPQKAKDIVSNKNRYNTDIFVQKCKEKYTDKEYYYDKVDYVNSKTKIKIFCNVIGGDNKPHGYFYTSPDLFLQGKGCPKCGNQVSIAENEIYNFILENFSNDEIIQHDTKTLNGYELDIFLPKYNFAIEYNGLRWHSEKFGKDKNYHLNKTLKCLEKGITLYQIFEDEFYFHKDLVFDKINNFLKCNYKKSKKIGARNCIIKEITTDLAVEFLNKYHIQNFTPSTVYLGAFYGNKIISVMTFKSEDKKHNNWDLNRFTTDYNYICQGVGSKMFKYFIKKYKPIQVKSFLDRRWCHNENDNLYIKLGFKLKQILPPDYRYTKGQYERLHKFGFRKQKLHKKYGFPLTMTEAEMTRELGYDRIWDCGLIKYVWQNKE